MDKAEFELREAVKALKLQGRIPAAEMDRVLRAADRCRSEGGSEAKALLEAVSGLISLYGGQP